MMHGVTTKKCSESFDSIESLELFDKLRNLSITLAFIRLVTTYQYTSGKRYMCETKLHSLQWNYNFQTISIHILNSAVPTDGSLRTHHAHYK